MSIDDEPEEYDEEDDRSLKEEESRVRSKFANERTFAAWLRTSITVIVVGLAIAEFVTATPGMEIPVLALGGGFVLAGVGLLGFAVYNYLTSRKQMKKADFHDPKKSLIVVAGALALLSLALLGVIAYGVVEGL
jgi:putative membrane protein